MDILLAHGYYLSQDPHEQAIMKPYPPLGLLYLSAYLKTRGFAVGVFDATFRQPTDFANILATEQPSLVGLSCNLMTKFQILAMLEAAKQHGARVILGGPEPASYAEEYLAYGADAIVIGEGETALEEILGALAKDSPHRLHHIPGIVFQTEDGTCVRTPPRPLITDLDSLPFPDREAIDLTAYLQAWQTQHGHTSVSLICARGCPYHCDWCSHTVYGKTHRRRSPARVADEVELLIKRYQPDQLWYADDVFTIKPSWLFSYAAELHQRKLHIPFECISRADRLNERIISTLAQMGCTRVWIGSESGSQRILDSMQRGVQVETVQAMTRLCQHYGIQVGMFIMLGYEGEQDRDLIDTVEHLKRAQPDIFLTTVSYPIKGTDYYRKVKDKLLSRTDWAIRTDRDLGIRDRHSQRYYAHATRWIVGEVMFHKHWQQHTKELGPLIKSAANVVRGKVGMALTRKEVES